MFVCIWLLWLKFGEVGARGGDGTGEWGMILFWKIKIKIIYYELLENIKDKLNLDIEFLFIKFFLYGRKL